MEKKESVVWTRTNRSKGTAGKETLRALLWADVVEGKKIAISRPTRWCAWEERSRSEGALDSKARAERSPKENWIAAKIFGREG